MASTRLPNPMTVIPELAKALVILAPIPALEPVTKATFPFHLFIFKRIRHTHTKLKLLFLFYDCCSVIENVRRCGRKCFLSLIQKVVECIKDGIDETNSKQNTQYWVLL